MVLCDFAVVFFAAPGISASPSEENMRYFNVMILGPSQSPYEGEGSSSFLWICLAVWLFLSLAMEMIDGLEI
jgi:hypothetical protein